ncbi:MoaD family protein [Candidatus Bathyarchaeota archaeon]|nr:MoaD family protein [Candidatus Bathyarchaeota archaeon]MBS7618218.1 MoaD family protein [Candidatus Bathyarchaeota archaeon]
MVVVKVFISSTLLEDASSKKLSLDVETVNDVLTRLLEIVGDKFRGKIYEGEDLSPRIVILVNNRNVRFMNGLNTKVNDGDVIALLPAIAGG